MSNKIPYLFEYAHIMPIIFQYDFFFFSFLFVCTGTASNMQPGDCILFNMKTIHAATKNVSDNFRIR